MNITTGIKSVLDDPFKSFKFLQRVIAVVCMMIPVIFRWTDEDKFDRQYANHLAVRNIQSLDSIRIDTLPIKVFKGIDSQLTVCVFNPKMELFSGHKINKDECGFRPSLSHYAYSSNSYVFGLLYCMAAMLFIFNGVVYMKNDPRPVYKKAELHLHQYGSWFNVLIGLSLIGVVLNPLYGREVLHILFSVLFFVLNIVVIAFFPNQQEKPLRKGFRFSLAVLATIFLLLPFISPLSILGGEWLSLIVIAAHLFLVALSVKRN